MTQTTINRRRALVELDTLEICDRLSDVRTKLRIAALACDGLEDTGDNAAIANMLMQLETDLKKIGNEVHPGPGPDEEIAYIKRQAEQRIAEVEADSADEDTA